MAPIDEESFLTGATYCLTAINMLEMLLISSISNLSAEVYFTLGTTDFTKSPTLGESVAVQTINCFGGGKVEIISLKNLSKMQNI